MTIYYLSCIYCCRVIYYFHFVVVYTYRETTTMSSHRSSPAMGTDGLQIKQEPIDDESDNHSSSSTADNSRGDVHMEYDEMNGQMNGDAVMDGEMFSDEHSVNDNGHSPLTNGVDNDLHIENNNILLKDAADVERSIEVIEGGRYKIKRFIYTYMSAPNSLEACPLLPWALFYRAAQADNFA